MTKILNEQERMNEITNALWIKLFADQLSRTARNNLTNINIYDNFSIDKQSMTAVIQACSDLMVNDKRRIPLWLSMVDIDDADELEAWLYLLKCHKIFSDEDVELLYNDYKSIVEEMERRW